MSDFFSSVIANTAAKVAGPSIVSEVHDLNRIHVEAADVDRAMASLAGARGWDAAEYGITREQAERMIREADTPAARDRVMADLRRRAVLRAGLDTSTGKVAVVVVGEAPWHRLGTNVSAALTAAQAIDLAQLNWPVTKRPMSYRLSDGSYRESGETFAVVRDDSQAQLGTVGGRYAVIQNAEGFAFLDSLLGEFGAKFHTAGAIHAGRMVWMQCELPEHSFEVVTGDAVQAFATFTNCHDGSGSAWCYPTTNRIVCANTYRVAGKDRSKGLAIRHTGEVKSRLKDARAALGLAIEGIDEFRDSASVMARTECDAPGFFADLLDAVLDVTAADCLRGADALAAAVAKTEAQREFEGKRIQREIDRRKTVLDDILARYDSDRCGVGGIRGTAWAAFNAVTEHADHVRPARKVGSEQAQASRRFESVLNGDADRIKQTAYQMLTDSARN